MIILGQVVSGAEAVEIGPVNRAVPADRLVDKVEAVCRQIVSLPSKTVAMAKAGLNGAPDLRGYAKAIEHGEDIAIANAEANKSNPACLEFHKAIAEHGAKAALKMVRSQGPWKG